MCARHANRAASGIFRASENNGEENNHLQMLMNNAFEVTSLNLILVSVSFLFNFVSLTYEIIIAYHNFEMKMICN